MYMDHECVFVSMIFRIWFEEMSFEWMVVLCWRGSFLRRDWMWHFVLGLGFHRMGFDSVTAWAVKQWILFLELAMFQLLMEKDWIKKVLKTFSRVTKVIFASNISFLWQLWSLGFPSQRHRRLFVALPRAWVAPLHHRLPANCMTVL